MKGFLPGGCPGVISVSASDGTGQFAASYSNFGAVTILAPGGDPSTTDEGGRPAWVWSIRKPNSQNQQGIVGMYGTTVAAAHVSGALALALAQHPDWRGNPDLIEQKLRACAAPLPAGACPSGCGAGKLDAARLVDGEAACASSVAASSPPPIPSRVASNAPAETAAPEKGHPLAGEWLLPEGDGVLVINAKGEWLHPKYGAARIRDATDDADINVFYLSGGTRCSYRTSFADGGKTLVLSSADMTQDLSPCPSGELKAAGR